MSSGVKYSRRRREALVWRAGGREESGVPRDRRSNDFLLRRREGTFPFSSIGAEFAAAAFFEAFAIPGSVTPPLKAIYESVVSLHHQAPDYPTCSDRLIPGRRIISSASPTGLEPLLWTPQCLQRRSQQWRTKERSIQRSFAGKWPNWSGRAANMGTCPGSLVQRIGRSENGSSKPSEMLSVAMAV